MPSKNGPCKISRGDHLVFQWTMSKTSEGTALVGTCGLCRELIKKPTQERKDHGEVVKDPAR